MNSISEPKLVFYLLLFLLVLNCNPLLYKEAQYATDDKVDAYLNRFQSMRPEAIKIGLLGYLTQAEKLKKETQSKGATEIIDLKSFRQFFMAEYALCPALLVHTVEAPAIVGNFSDDQSGIEEAAKRGLQVENAYGQGVFLLIRKKALK